MPSAPHSTAPPAIAEGRRIDLKLVGLRHAEGVVEPGSDGVDGGIRSLHEGAFPGDQEGAAGVHRHVRQDLVGRRVGVDPELRADQGSRGIEKLRLDVLVEIRESPGSGRDRFARRPRIARPAPWPQPISAASAGSGY